MPQNILYEFDKVCKRRKLKVNIGKCKVMVCVRIERGENLDSSLNEEMLEEVDPFKYLGSVISKNWVVVDDVIMRVNEGAKGSGALSRIWKVGLFSIGADCGIWG